jgi:RluA family pseudouridine synthase
MVEYTVGPMEAGKKVHRLVRQLLPGVPLSGIHKMIRTGRVKRNGKKAKPDDVIEAGDVIRLYMAEADFERVSKSEKKFRGISSDIEVVFEDESMLVVSKPVGLLTHGAEGEHKDTLVNRVLAYLYQKGELNQKIFTPSSVNRLDRNTSGLVVFGKTGAATRALADDIAEHRIRKWYLAIVQGTPKPAGEISAKLSRFTEVNRTVVDNQGKSAITKYRTLVSTGRTSVVQIELVSGRTHQIRAHFSHIGHPLYGDVKYGGGRPGAGRQGAEHHQWLHAAWLRLADGRLLFAPLPAPFIAKLKSLGYTNEQIADVSRHIPEI